MWWLQSTIWASHNSEDNVENTIQRIAASRGRKVHYLEKCQNIENGSIGIEVKGIPAIVVEGKSAPVSTEASIAIDSK